MTKMPIANLMDCILAYVGMSLRDPEVMKLAAMQARGHSYVSG